MRCRYANMKLTELFLLKQYPFILIIIMITISDGTTVSQLSKQDIGKNHTPSAVLCTMLYRIAPSFVFCVCGEWGTGWGYNSKIILFLTMPVFFKKLKTRPPAHVVVVSILITMFPHVAQRKVSIDAHTQHQSSSFHPEHHRRLVFVFLICISLYQDISFIK